ncbi:hypothetical protein VCR20J5_1240149 [Vibrio crassostreae]|nr:hypothetical protein VCR20J5_1240149 [Vibrio crassostreae]
MPLHAYEGKKERTEIPWASAHESIELFKAVALGKEKATFNLLYINRESGL